MTIPLESSQATLIFSTVNVKHGKSSLSSAIFLQLLGFKRRYKYNTSYHVAASTGVSINKQLLDEVEHDIVNYQNRGLCYLPKPKAEADNTDTRF